MERPGTMLLAPIDRRPTEEHILYIVKAGLPVAMKYETRTALS